MPKPASVLIIAGLGVLLGACTLTPGLTPEFRPGEMIASPVSFDALPGWQDDDHGAALTAFVRSCQMPKESRGPAYP